MNQPNPHLVQRLDAIQQSLTAQHAGGVGLPSAQAGNERETFLREFLQKVFPSHRRFSTGAITDSSGAISGQVDIAIEYGFMPSFPMPATESRLLLAESVAMVIEVKSDLGKQWQEVQRTVSHVRQLNRKINPIAFLGSPISVNIPVVAVGYRGYQAVEKLAERLSSTPESDRPDAALVIESGCFVGFDMNASGSFGLYALCIGINRILSKLLFAAPDLLSYVQAKPDSSQPK